MSVARELAAEVPRSGGHPDRPPRAWVLNLDAEHELEAGTRYAPTAHLRAIVARERQRLVGELVAPHDVVLDDDDFDPGSPGNRTLRARQLEGAAWLPTPRALKRLAAAGATAPADTAPVEVLRRVNARPFAVDVRAELVRDSFAKHVVLDLEAALARLATPAALGWLVRREFGAAGRGRRRLHAGRPSDDERAWLVASLRRGPLTIEPWVEVTREFTRSGFVAESGEIVIAPPCFQETTDAGAWVRTHAAAPAEVRAEHDLAVQEAFERAGRALADAGYVGPYGIDAFLHRAVAPDGSVGAREVLNPMSEINARFTMDWASSLRT